ncbi:MAG: GNAT family N-acetyltransferase [Acidimicrobiales bacterium]
MSAARSDVIRWGRERVRTRPWRGQERVACISPLPDAPAPSPAFLGRCARQLSDQGFARVVTTALSPSEQASFLVAGFEIEERLHLLAHDLRHIPPTGDVALHRVPRSARPSLLGVDAAAFPAFWRIDEDGLAEAMGATAHARLRGASLSGTLVGYAVTGRSARRGFLQRLAVDPPAPRLGLGRALVVDALVWLRRRRVDRAVVNTQLGNEAALALYQGVGFRLEPNGLCVLSLALGP